jgi:GNAT superfamily N-acetyltransferase
LRQRMIKKDWIDPNDIDPPDVDPSGYEGQCDDEPDLEAAAEAEIEAALEAAEEARADREAELAEELRADWYDETQPWADPEIQRGYQAALGEFIVTFNRLDAGITNLLRFALADIGKLELLPQLRGRGYGAKLQALELLQTSPSMKAIHGAPIDEMKKIAAIRNFLAHAHFDQNPYDGTYELVPPKSDKNPPERHLKEEAVRKWTGRIKAASDHLRTCEAAYWFRDVPQRNA